MIRISRRAFLTATAVLASGFGRSQAYASNPTFLVVGDWGTASDAQRKIAAQMARTAGAIGSRFVISTGDNFYPRGVKSVDDAKWDTHFEEIYDAPALMIPWYATLGNHDHKGNVGAQVDYTLHSSRWRLPARYYKHVELLADGSKAVFFHLDTTPIEKKCEEEQLVWLERELEASRAAWRIVVGHHPVHSGGEHGDSYELIVILKPLLERFGVQAYLNGHDHHLEHVRVGKVHYLTSGAGAKPRAAKAHEGTRFIAGDRLGFLYARLSPTALSIEFIDEAGTALYRASIPAHNAAPDRTGVRRSTEVKNRARLPRAKQTNACDGSAAG